MESASLGREQRKGRSVTQSPDEKPSFEELARRLDAKRAKELPHHRPLARPSADTRFACAAWLNGASSKQLTTLYGISRQSLQIKLDKNIGHAVRLARPHGSNKPGLSWEELVWLRDEFNSRRTEFESLDTTALAVALRTVLADFPK